MKLKNQNNNNNSNKITNIELEQHFSGPLPPPFFLEKYELILPGAAERFFKMAEENSEHLMRCDIEKINLAKEQARNYYKAHTLGQVLGFICFLSVVILCAYAFYMDKDILGLAMVLSACAAVIASFFYRKKIKKE